MIRHNGDKNIVFRYVAVIYYGHRSEREEVKVVVVVADRHHRSRTSQPHILDVETIFQVVDDSDTLEKEELDENDTTSSKQPRPRRIRISFSLDFTKSSTEVLSNIVTIHVEQIGITQDETG